MAYHHGWDRPTVVRHGGGSRAFYHPIQTCPTCGTTRNPLTLAIITRGSNDCWRSPGWPGEGDPQEYSGALARVKEELGKLEASGERVDRSWSPGRRRELRENHSLFEPEGSPRG